jgi:8-oxo-dGTP pyrophosphatase MutT (NUDIX family)
LPIPILTLQELKQKFSFTPNPILIQQMRESAVLVIFYQPHPNELFLILTQRTLKLNKHGGEISFPGGKFEPERDGDKINTALRECEEEIGVNRNDLTVIGIMDDIATLTGFIITPVVAYTNKELTFVKSEDEVQEILVVPIDFFLDGANFTEIAMKTDNEQIPVYTYIYKPEGKASKSYSIWGATAHILMELMKTLYSYNPSKLNLKRLSPEKIEMMLEKRREELVQKAKAKNVPK